MVPGGGDPAGSSASKSACCGTSHGEGERSGRLLNPQEGPKLAVLEEIDEIVGPAINPH